MTSECANEILKNCPQWVKDYLAWSAGPWEDVQKPGSQDSSNAAGHGMAPVDANGNRIPWHDRQKLVDNRIDKIEQQINALCQGPANRNKCKALLLTLGELLHLFQDQYAAGHSHGDGTPKTWPGTFPEGFGGSGTMLSHLFDDLSQSTDGAKQKTCEVIKKYAECIRKHCCRESPCTIEEEIQRAFMGPFTEDHEDIARSGGTRMPW